MPHELTLLISVVVFMVVSALVGVLAFVFRDNLPQDRRRGWTCWSASGAGRTIQAQDILRKSAFEGDKKTFLEAITPKFLYAAEDVRAGRLPHQAEHPVRHRRDAGRSRCASRLLPSCR